MRLPEGWKSYIWEAIKGAVSVPTIAGGGHRTPELCEKILADGKAVFQGGQFPAQQANQVPVRIEGGDGTPGHSQHIGFSRRGLDARMQIGRELAQADG